MSGGDREMAPRPVLDKQAKKNRKWQRENIFRIVFEKRPSGGGRLGGMENSGGGALDLASGKSAVHFFSLALPGTAPFPFIR